MLTIDMEPMDKDMKKDIKDEIDPMIMEMSWIDCILMWSSMKSFKAIIRDRARIAKEENDERYKAMLYYANRAETYEEQLRKAIDDYEDKRDGKVKK